MTLFYKISRQCLRTLFRILYRHESYLLDGSLLSGKGAIIAANHASFLDPPLIAVSWPEPIHFLARKGLFEKLLLQPIIKGLNAHPLGGTNDHSSLKLACKLLQEGKKILVFPEGTRTHDGHLAPFKNGISLLAKRSGCPIIPAYIHGSFELWPRSRSRPYLWGQKTACVFGSPIAYEEDGLPLPLKIQQEIERLKAWYTKL